jgi:hypothetical protein
MAVFASNDAGPLMFDSTTNGTSDQCQNLGILSDVMTYDDLLALVRGHEGKTLETITGKRFRVGI